MFTANYAGHFDVLLPGLAALRLPFPLGGSSNHFRTSILRKVGGWDPYNVTEDADLGFRLHRLGYQVATLASTTYEEAPARLGPWLKQRTRWYKGWMQTWCVHMRQPLRLLRQLGLKGMVAFQLLLACNILAPLVHPFVMALLCYEFAAHSPLEAIQAMGRPATVFMTTMLAGYASTVALDLTGLQRRGLLRHAWVLLLTPLHWFLLSIAAWRAFCHLNYNPHLWEKTEHGLAKSSRIAAQRARDNACGVAAPVAPAMLIAGPPVPLDQHHAGSPRTTATPPWSPGRSASIDAGPDSRSRRRAANMGNFIVSVSLNQADTPKHRIVKNISANHRLPPRRYAAC